MIRTAGNNTSTVTPSIGSLFRDLADETRTLFHQEVELAKTELTEKAVIVGKNIAFLAVGGMILYAGLLALIAGAGIGAFVLLNQVMDVEIALWLGPLLVGVIVALIGYAFVQKAILNFKRENLTPRQTMNSLRENKEWFKDQMTTSTTVGR